MSASDCRRSENFLAEFGEELDRACFVENDAIVKQGVRMGDDECVYHFIELRDARGKLVVFKQSYPILVPGDGPDEILDQLRAYLGVSEDDVVRIEDLKSRIEKADLL